MIVPQASHREGDEPQREAKKEEESLGDIWSTPLVKRLVGGLQEKSLEFPFGLRVKAEAGEEAPELLTVSGLAPPSLLSPVSFTFAFLPQAFCLERTAGLA